MFDRIKNLLGKPMQDAGAKGGSVGEWAHSVGLSHVDRGAGRFGIEGKWNKHAWALELGPSTRDFIAGEQLRGKIGLDVDPNVTVIVMSRPLKEALDQRVFKLYTDSVQTMASPEMQDEMRWVTIFDEFGWEGLPLAFWHRYSVMADKRANAALLVNEQLCEVLMNWPEQEAGQSTPFTLNFSRGKIYLRMEYRPAELTTVQHAAAVLLTACEVATAGFPLPA
jgi:hypothetical protein